jgi:hypothetical protein
VAPGAHARAYAPQSGGDVCRMDSVLIKNLIAIGAINALRGKTIDADEEMLRIAMAHEDPAMRAKLLTILLRNEVSAAEIGKFDDAYEGDPKPDLKTLFLRLAAPVSTSA